MKASESEQSAKGSSEPAVDARIVGRWLALQEKIQFPLGCDSGVPVRYFPNGTYLGPGARGTWQLKGSRLTEIVQEVDAEGDPDSVGSTYTGQIAWNGSDVFVRTFPGGYRLTFRRCPSEAAARSDAVDRLLQEQLAEACYGSPGTIDPSAIIESDLTGDGNADLIISHEGITCERGGSSGFCGAQLCLINIYVRRGLMLKLELEIMGAGVSVSGREIRLQALNGRQQTIKWDGKIFR